ncbi:inorganic phosphate transporter PHO84 [Aspergillus udagawae]|uniref:Inorganic phosphate transporter PHO84 n=1 Tax=Aspergillus udagawae TaxID=91492 RepID=A0ABQ1AD02_9EURO|nr:inorganic phosphate transporter PHO84 [Aspergillus udagawae]
MRYPRLAALGLRFYPWKGYQDFRHHTPAQRHAYIIGRLESARRREWMWIVVVAGLGFFTDAYGIFSVNMVLPMMNIVYWNHSNWTEANAVRHDYEVALSIVTLGGVLLGQIAFGVAADVWGRSKMYGMELAILIFATLGLALSSSGAENSMSAIALFLFWRGLLGVGLGGDYPLSAVICSEFAPTRLRGRLLATVFFCQSLGQLAAQLVALIAVVGFQHRLPTDPNTTTCTGNCIRSLDTIWRLLVGLGAVPAFIALWFRLTIIESPRYTAEVTKDSLQAVNDVSQFYHRVSIDSASVNSVEPPSPQSGSFRLSPTQSADQQPEQPASAAPFEEQDAISPLAIWKDFKLFLRQKDNFRKLAATSLCWFCLDLPFYGLGLISPRITRTIWFGSKLPRTSLYQLLFQTAYQSIVVVSSGAIVGSLLSILTIDKLGRRNIQLNGFFWLFLLNVVIGASFQHLVKQDDPSALVVLYILCQIFFNFGPNTTTYMLPAELFPTRFRCTCHGIAAAFGKLGSILAQCFLAYVDFGNGKDYTNVPNWLGYALLCLSLFMLMGLLITYFLIPDVRDKDGRIKSLEELTHGMMPDAEFSQAVTNGYVGRGSSPEMTQVDGDSVSV